MVNFWLKKERRLLLDQELHRVGLIIPWTQIFATAIEEAERMWSAVPDWKEQQSFTYILHNKKHDGFRNEVTCHFSDDLHVGTD